MSLLWAAEELTRRPLASDFPHASMPAQQTVQEPQRAQMGLESQAK
jgi:hypothetical protein